MKHVYLSEASIKEALASGAITADEAQRLINKIESQAAIFKSLQK